MRLACSSALEVLTEMWAWDALPTDAWHSFSRRADMVSRQAVHAIELV
jgi:hypothetical protein